MKVLFFGQVREWVAVDHLMIDSPPETVRALRKDLALRGENWAEALNHRDLLVAVNQTLCDDDTRIESADEVAFFPPVTGG